ncbi:MAG: hypothetical protein ACYTFG_11595, partial [Planctomycetota bacterium]
MRALFPILLLAALSAGAGSVLAESGSQSLPHVVAARAAFATLKTQDMDAFRSLARELLEKKCRETAESVLDVLEALEPGSPEWEVLRSQTLGMDSETRTLNRWASRRKEKAFAPARKAWTGLLETCKAHGVHHTGHLAAVICTAIDPDHAVAHRFLGREKAKGRWLDAFERKLAGAGRAFDETWGPVSGAEKEKLESGLRLLQGRWVPRAEEEKAKRALNDAVVLEDGWIRLDSTLPFDLSLAVSRDLRREFARLRGFFGDFFHPPATARPCRIFLMENGDRMKDVLRAFALAESAAEHTSIYDHGTHAVYARADRMSLPERGVSALEVWNPLARDVTYWFLKATPGCSFAGGPGQWALTSAAILVESNHLPPLEKATDLRWLDDYVRSVTGKKPIEFDALSRMDLARLLAEPEATATGFALFHYFTHAGEAARPARLLAYLKDVLAKQSMVVQAESGRHLGLFEPDLPKRVEKHVRAFLEKRRPGPVAPPRKKRAPSCRGLESFEALQAVRMESAMRRVEDADTFRKYAAEFVEGGLKGPAERALSALEALEPGSAEGKALRAKAAALKPSGELEDRIGLQRLKTA